MTKEQAIAMLKAKRECIELDTNGNAELCNRNCGECKLNYEQGNMGEQKIVFDMAIKVLEQETVSKETYDIEHFARKQAEQKLYEIQQNTSEDCVSRQAVDQLCYRFLSHSAHEIAFYEHFCDLPPVIPTRKSGLHWIERFDNENKWLECPHCHIDSDNNECLDNAYNKGYQDGKKDFTESNGQAEYNKGYNSAINDYNMMFKYMFHNIKEFRQFLLDSKYYDTELVIRGSSTAIVLFELIRDFDIAEVISEFKKWQEEKKKS